jgi:excinuclease UvrABC nuclease subunit
MISLHDLTPCAWDALPERPCVYVIHVDGEALYVGQTGNMWRRWTSHSGKWRIKNSYPSATISVLFTDSDSPRERRELEKEFIRNLLPRLNKQGVLRKYYFTRSGVSCKAAVK